MKCTSCKQTIPDGTKFCPNCGTKIEIPDAPPPPPTDGISKWDKNLPLIGAGIGLGSGFIALMGWFSHWTSLKFGNGPQLIALPFGLTSGAKLLNDYPALGTIFQSVDEITGWVLLISILLAIISIVLVIMCGLLLWQGVKCLEYRADPELLPTVKNSINKIGNYAITGIVFVVAVMVLVSVFQFGESAIGGGLVAMAFGFIAGFIAVIYLKPHLR